MGKTILVFLLLTSSVFSQIFTESFNWFPFDTLTGTAGWTHDDTLLNHFGCYPASCTNVTNLIDAVDLTAAGAFDNVSGFSILSRGGKRLEYQGSSDYHHAGDNYDPGTSDFTLQIWIETPSDVNTNKYIVNKRDGGSEGWQIDVFSNEFRAGMIGETFATVAAVADTPYYAWVRFDRDGNLILTAYGNGTTVSDTVDISGSSAVDIDVTENFTIGSYSDNPALSEWDGGIYAVKYSALAVSDQRLVEDAFLAENWKSGAGNVTRQNWGFHQGITGGSLIVKTKGSADSSITLTGDSTQYTVNYGAETSLLSDSIMFKTASGGTTDSVWYPLPDSTFAANRGLQIVFSGWETSGVTYIDSLSVTTYALSPEIGVSPTSYDFGDVTVGDSGSVAITVSNTGDGLLTVSDFSANNETIIIVPDLGFTVNAGSSNPFTIYFVPTSSGEYLDTLVIVNDDADESNLEVPLSGTGVVVTATTEEKPRKLKSFQTLSKL